MTVMQEKIKVGIHCGIHSRVAIQLAEIASENNVEMEIVRDKERIDCRSILEVLGLALVQGSHIYVRARGEQAAKALSNVKCLLAGKNL